MTDWSLAAAKRMLRDRGARRIFAKLLSPNDNSKNQIYLGGDFEILQVLPSGEHVPSASGRGNEPIFKAPLALSWIDPSGRAFRAPNSQLILYPQYPEVRMSGFLRGAQWAPSEVLTVRDEGRILLLGTTTNSEVLAIAANTDSQLAREVANLDGIPKVGVLLDLGSPEGPSASEAKSLLLKRLCDIAHKGWLEAWRLNADGSRADCNSPNCVGVTLESELGIVGNGRAEPDFLGWEVKAATVASLQQPRLGTITLMTPEPTGGHYRESGVESFVRKYGYSDKLGRDNRLNFGGIHRVGARHPTTRLTVVTEGYDSESETILDAGGKVALLDAEGNVAASWDFPSLLLHWNRKHALAAYVPAAKREDGSRLFAYGKNVLLCEGTSFLRFLSALASGTIYYDPGIKLELQEGRWKSKRRSQWRIAGRNISSVYRNTSWTHTCEPAME